MPNRTRHSAVILRLKRKKKPIDPREEPFNVAFGMRLKDAREESRLSQARLSERLGIGYHQYKKYEYGRPFPIYLLRDLASILDKPLSWLLSGR